MADITIGFKGSTEFKEKIDNMVHASGMDKKEWIQHLVSIYELQHLKEQEGLMKYLGDLNALEEHTGRINEIFSSLTKKVLDEQKRYTSEKANLEQEKNNTIEALTSQLERIQEVLSQKDEELKTIAKEQKETLKQQIQLEELNESHKINIAEKQKEIDRLSDAYNNLKARSSEEQIKQLTDENILLSNQLELIKVRHEANIYKLESELKGKYVEEIKSLLYVDPIKKKLGRPKKNPDNDKRDAEDAVGSEDDTDSYHDKNEQ